MEKARTKAITNNPTTHNSQEKAIHNRHHTNNNTTLNLRHHNIHRPQLNKFPKATTRAMGNNGTKEARKVNKFQYNKSMTTTTTMERNQSRGTTPGTILESGIVSRWRHRSTMVWTRSWTNSSTSTWRIYNFPTDNTVSMR
eukprot:6491279-Amphidinium_carterae.4